MIDIQNLVNTKKIVDPITKDFMVISSDNLWLVSSEGNNKYKIVNESVPILLEDPSWAELYLNNAKKMMSNYSKSSSLEQNVKRVFYKFIIHDFRSDKSKEAFNHIFEDLTESSICLSIGGGPTRPNPKLINLNIAPFPNVDIVADAHLLPFADESVDSIYCEAVLEHLHNPVKAVSEMHRVLKRGGKALVITPFMQAYHGYPHHYQNFTVTGHNLLFENFSMFNILESGTCVGPTYTLVDTISIFLNEYAPGLTKKPLRLIWELIGACIRPLDLVLNGRSNSYILASTIFTLIEKV